MTGSDIVHNHAVGGFVHVLVAEPAPVDQTNSHGLQVPGAHNVNLGSRLEPSTSDQPAMILTAERERIDGSHALNPGKHTYRVQYAPEQQSVLFRSVISITGGNDHRCQYPFCVKPGIGPQQSNKACQELPPNHYQGH